MNFSHKINTRLTQENNLVKICPLRESLEISRLKVFEYFSFKKNRRAAVKASGDARQYGVTIIELLVVIFVIGVLIAYVAPTALNRAARNARITTTRQKMDQLRKTIVGNSELISGGEYVDAGFKGDMGRLPTSLLELVDTTITPKWNPFTKHGWNGPYIRDDGKHSFIFDAWGDSIVFLEDDLGDTIGLQSKGPDGEWYDGTIPVLTNDDIQILF